MLDTERLSTPRVTADFAICQVRYMCMHVRFPRLPVRLLFTSRLPPSTKLELLETKIFDQRLHAYIDYSSFFDPFRSQTWLADVVNSAWGVANILRTGK